jgi:hypothetical protein
MQAEAHVELQSPAALYETPAHSKAAAHAESLLHTERKSWHSAGWQSLGLLEPLLELLEQAAR